MWDLCSASCGDAGARSRVFFVAQPAAYGGQECMKNDGEMETEFCNTANPCPRHCVGAWQEWSQCVESCGTGAVSTRVFRVVRAALFGGDSCVLSDGDTETDDCSTVDHCPVDCLGGWTAWSACYDESGAVVEGEGTCSLGTYNERFFVVVRPAQFGGINCQVGNNTIGTHATQYRACDPHPEEPVDGCPAAECNGVWGEWSTCSRECGSGLRHRSFALGETADGERCADYDEDTVQRSSCNTNFCPIDCEGSWNEWQSCDPADACGGHGVQSRSYQVTIAAAFGGTACLDGASPHGYRPCGSSVCPSCSGAWSDFSECSVSCGVGTMTRSFFPDLESAGNCNSSTHVIPCSKPTCSPPVHCEGEWEQWSSCTASCGGVGVRHREYRVDVPASNGGSACNFGLSTDPEFDVCNTEFCPGCTGVWSEFDTCDVSCGVGTAVRTFVADDPELCDVTMSSITCNEGSCPIACEGEWGAWGACSESCGGFGVRQRSWVVTQEPAFGGMACWPLVEEEACGGSSPCSGCEGAWSSFSDCDVTCGTGLRWRTFTADGGFQCELDGTVQSLGCSGAAACQPPSEDCVGEWSVWGSCSRSCGTDGQRAQTFRIGQVATFGGEQCDFDAEDVQLGPCNRFSCPIDCEGDWSEWSDCSISCDDGVGGTVTRSFFATVAPEFGGKECGEPRTAELGITETISCGSLPTCQPECTGTWGAWGDCSVSCGDDGTRTRVFETEISGCELSETKTCNGGDCEVPVDCVGAWDAWSDCSESCGGLGLKYSTFLVRTDASDGGKECIRSDGTVRLDECNRVECPPQPIDCAGEWSAWTTCDETCGPTFAARHSHRTFQVSVVAENGGSQCEALDGITESLICAPVPECSRDCFGDWTEWSECFGTCGPFVYNERFYVRVQEAAFGGMECPFADATPEYRACDPVLEPCRDDCEGDWTEWTSCSASCGVGATTRSFVERAERMLADSAEHPNDYATNGCAGTQLVSCEVYPCPVDCEGEWGVWGVCSETCGGLGTQERVFQPSVAAAFGGDDSCPASERQERVCGHSPCEGCEGFWTTWSACDASCGSGAQTRLFSARSGGECELHGTTQSRACDSDERCPDTTTQQATSPVATPAPTESVDCVGGWSVWGSCDRTCGVDLGTQHQTFIVSRQATSGGKVCADGHGDTRARACGDTECPNDCHGAWSDYSECTVTCGDRGTTTRTFHWVYTQGCDEVPDDIEQTVSCWWANEPCPVDCVGGWSAWTDCSQTCGPGTKQRWHTVLQEAAYGGIACDWSDSFVQYETCVLEACTTTSTTAPLTSTSIEATTFFPTPTSTVSTATATSASTSLKQSTYEVATPSAPTTSLAESTSAIPTTTTVTTATATTVTTATTTSTTTAASTTSTTVTTTPPAVDCTGTWSDWGPCSKRCNWGEQTRTFSVSAPAAFGGQDCVVTHETVNIQSCNKFECRRELAVFDFQGVYATSTVLEYLHNDGNASVPAVAEGEYTSSTLGIGENLDPEILAVYDDPADRFSGFAMITLVIVNAVKEGLGRLGLDTTDDARYTVGSCGVSPSEVEDGSFDTSVALCIPDGSASGTCRAAYGLCVLVTNVSVVPRGRSYWRSEENSSGLVISFPAQWGYESVAVSFALVSDAFFTQTRNQELNQIVATALVDSLAEGFECGNVCESITRATITDLGKAVIEGDWLEILADPYGDYFELGYSLDPRVCSDGDADDVCDFADECFEGIDGCCTDSDGDGICDSVDSCPFSAANDADGDLWCDCNETLGFVERCDCNDTSIAVSTVCEDPPDFAINNGPVRCQESGTNPVVWHDLDDVWVDEDGDTYCDGDDTLWYVIGALVGLLGIAAGVGVVIRNSALALRMQVFQKEVINDAVNRGRPPAPQLLDLSAAEPLGTMAI
eukprot:INCI799.1.p1 GENE.INCI799.1~~INCI799.1.p1  ORF type:complete len:2111 (-),score=241.46 INCI799.1:204-5903(-)